MTEMSRDERREFLLTGTRTAKVATVRRDGQPHVTPIWFVMDGDELVFTTSRSSVKGRALLRDGRICLCVDDERPPYAFVVIDGTVTLLDDLEQLRYWATRIGGRYMGNERAEEYGARNGVPGELVVRVRPTHVVTEAEVAR
jgi:PPOX class probable F420-dependent enzyme